MASTETKSKGAANPADVALLRTLSTCHYIVGGFVTFIGVLLLSIFLLLRPPAAPNGSHQLEYLALVFLASITILGVANIVSGKFLRERRRRGFSTAVALVDAATMVGSFAYPGSIGIGGGLSVPVLGIFGLISLFVLMKNSIPDCHRA
jgi:hypothetical protein